MTASCATTFSGYVEQASLHRMTYSWLLFYCVVTMLGSAYDILCGCAALGLKFVIKSDIALVLLPGAIIAQLVESSKIALPG